MASYIKKTPNKQHASLPPAEVFDSAMLERIVWIHFATWNCDCHPPPITVIVFPTAVLDDHISKLHSDGSNSCSECFTVFSRPSQLRVHSQSCAYPKSVINDSMTKSMVQLTTQTPPDGKFSFVYLSTRHMEIRAEFETS